MTILIPVFSFFLTVITLILAATAKITTTPEGGSYPISYWAFGGIMALFALTFYLGDIFGKIDQS